jgi:hypothetical protein
VRNIDIGAIGRPDSRFHGMGSLRRFFISAVLYRLGRSASLSYPAYRAKRIETVAVHNCLGCTDEDEMTLGETPAYGTVTQLTLYG